MILPSTTDIITEASKLNTRPPYRPIVSCIGTITEHISGFVDLILQPLLQKITSYLKDTTHFLCNCHIATLATGSMLISMDANSLYTNIPHADEVAACRSFVYKTHDIQSDIATDIPILIDIILKYNTFTFKDK